MTLADYSMAAFALLNGGRAIAYVPQMIRVYRDPHGAAAVSVTTWALFTAANLATAFYAITAFHDLLMAFIFGLNALGCALIVGMTILKRLSQRSGAEWRDACLRDVGRVVRGGVMDSRQDRIRSRGTDQRPEDGIAHETGAVCTACAWLVLYGMAMTGSLLLGSWQHKHGTSIVAAAAENLEHRK